MTRVREGLSSHARSATGRPAYAMSILTENQEDELDFHSRGEQQCQKLDMSKLPGRVASG